MPSTMIELRDTARAALSTLYTRLLALSEETGELAGEARRAWLLAQFPLADYTDIEHAITLVGNVVEFVDNWSECGAPDRRRKSFDAEDHRRARNVVLALVTLPAEERRALGEPVGTQAMLDVAGVLATRGEGLTKAELEESAEERLDRLFVEPARAAAHDALLAVCGLVDFLIALRVPLQPST